MSDVNETQQPPASVRNLANTGDPKTPEATAPAVPSRSLPWAFVAGAAIGILGGLIGLGGAEFRLPLLIGVFGFAALHAVIMNKAMSLIVVLTALPARLLSIPFSDLAPHWNIVLNLLAGSLVGAWLGATWATKMRSATLYKVLAPLLVLIAATLALTHVGQVGTLNLPLAWQLIAGVTTGVLIGIVAAIMGVAGGELLIPTIVLLYGLDIKLAGSLSLAVSPADNVGRLRPLQPRPELYRPPPEQGLRPHHGRWFHRRHHPRRLHARHRAQRDPHPAPRDPARLVRDQGLATPLTPPPAAVPANESSRDRHDNQHRPAGDQSASD